MITYNSQLSTLLTVNPFNHLTLQRLPARALTWTFTSWASLAGCSPARWSHRGSLFTSLDLSTTGCTLSHSQRLSHLQITDTPSRPLHAGGWSTPWCCSHPKAMTQLVKLSGLHPLAALGADSAALPPRCTRSPPAQQFIVIIFYYYLLLAVGHIFTLFLSYSYTVLGHLPVPVS